MTNFITSLFRSTLAACVLMLAASCSEVTIEGPDHEIGIMPMSSVQTKASSAGPIANTTFPTGRTIYLSAYYNDPNGTSHSQGMFTDHGFTYYTPSGGSAGWHGGTSGSPALRYWPHQGTMDFIALSKEGLAGTISHTGAKNTTSVTYAMPDNSSVQDDIMMAYKGSQSCASHGTVGLTFKHCQAQVAVTAACTINDASNNYGVSIRSVTLRKAKHSGTVVGTPSGSDGITMAWSDLGTQTNKAFGSSTQRLTTSQAAYGTGILLPGQAPTGVSSNIDILIEYTLHNGKVNSSDLDQDFSYVYTVPSTTWEAGNKYTYAFTFSMNEITCSPTVTAWADGGTVPEPDTRNAISFSLSIYNQTDSYVNITASPQNYTSYEQKSLSYTYTIPGTSTVQTGTIDYSVRAGMYRSSALRYENGYTLYVTYPGDTYNKPWSGTLYISGTGGGLPLIGG